jgi:predicted enzyme related to lactoylglutathione lyase
MSNPHGTPIWYELITADPDAAGAFYMKVIGWQDGGCPGGTAEGTGDYHVYLAPDGQGVAGMMKTPEGAPPQASWFGYICVDDVDAAAEKVAASGGAIHMPPTTIAGVGRMAMVADPGGVMFYLMKGESPEASTAFKRMAPGHGEWNELYAADDQTALDFYAAQFGWTKDGGMPMGEMGEYSFLSHQGEMIGAVMRAPQGERPRWQYYFRVGLIEEAKARIEAAGGTVQQGPMEVPGGDWIIVAADPQGAGFGVVGTKG